MKRKYFVYWIHFASSQLVFYWNVFLCLYQLLPKNVWTSQFLWRRTSWFIPYFHLIMRLLNLNKMNLSKHLYFHEDGTFKISLFFSLGFYIEQLMLIELFDPFVFFVLWAHFETITLKAKVHTEQESEFYWNTCKWEILK